MKTYKHEFKPSTGLLASMYKNSPSHKNSSTAKSEGRGEYPIVN